MEGRQRSNMEQVQKNVPDSTINIPKAQDMPADATQRVHIATQTPARRPASAPQRRTASAPARKPAPASKAAPTRASDTKPPVKSRKSKKKATTIITLSIIAAVLLVAIIATCAILFSTPEDDGLILHNVHVAGVNIGGKTPEEAKKIILEATANTYDKLDMVVEVYESTITLSPSQTGARLDVDAIVEAAFNYGRTGSRAERQKIKNQALTTPHYMSVLPYLNLNNDYIRQKVDELGNLYSSTLVQPSYEIVGTRPDLNMSNSEIDFNKAYQKLYITIGTPEYGLNTDKLYNQILDAYNSQIFEVAANMSVELPESVNLDAIYAELCINPTDAVLDEFTYTVSPEKNGFGFPLDEVKALVAEADYGETIEVPLRFIRPNLTEEELTDGLFETKLAFISTIVPIDDATRINLKLVCRAINGQRGGLILKADDIFSFNEFIGAPTEANGYKEVMTYVGKTPQNVIGGGISQVASALYYCALQADMEILARTNHAYAPNFIEAGFDADIRYGTTDLSFKNTTGRPIRIEAEVTDEGRLELCIWGTAHEDYTIEIVYEILETYKPDTLINVMIPDNEEEYLDGDILVQPVVGYDICTYKYYRYSDPEMEPIKKLIAFSHYDKLDKVIVRLEDPTDPSNPTTQAPSDPTAPSTPSS